MGDCFYGALYELLVRAGVRCRECGSEVCKSVRRVVAEVVLAAPEAHGVVFTAGETSSYGRVAEVVEKVLALEVEREEWTVERLRQDSAQDPENGMKKYRVVFAEGKGVAWDTEHTFNVQRGMGLQGVEDWARLNLS